MGNHNGNHRQMSGVNCGRDYSELALSWFLQPSGRGSEDFDLIMKAAREDWWCQFPAQRVESTRIAER